MARDTQNGQHKDRGYSTVGSALDYREARGFFPQKHTKQQQEAYRHILNSSTVEVGLGSKIGSSGSSSAKIKFEASLGNTRFRLKKKKKKVNKMLKHNNTLSDFKVSKLQ